MLPLRTQQANPDFILWNAKVITVDEQFTIAQALAIQGDRIVAVGSNQEVARLAGPATRKIDLKGRSVIPGLIDNHMHLLRAASTWTKELRFDGIDTRKQAIEMIRARAKEVGPGQWVYGLQHRWLGHGAIHR
jgi:predicted amidohydrolase YtcJ